MEKHGSLNIRRRGSDQSTGQLRYSLTYAPYDRGGGALPPRVAQTDDELKGLLIEIGLDQEIVERAVRTARVEGRVSIPDVTLTDEQVQRYGLKEMGIGASILSYIASF
jgi:hypothetical protein